MTDEEQVLAKIRAMVAALPHDDRIQVEAIATTLRSILRIDRCATLAYSLVGAELAAVD